MIVVYSYEKSPSNSFQEFSLMIRECIMNLSKQSLKTSTKRKRICLRILQKLILIAYNINVDNTRYGQFRPLGMFIDGMFIWGHILCQVHWATLWQLNQSHISTKSNKLCKLQLFLKAFKQISESLLDS